MLNIVDMKRYVVFIGRKPGVYDEWVDCHNQVIGFSRACYRSFKTKEDAVAAYNKHVAANNAAHVLETEKAIAPGTQFGCAFIIALVLVLVSAAFAKLLM